MPTRSPAQVSVALRNSFRAMKAIRFAAMFATSEIATWAPDDAASMMFRSGLHARKKQGRLSASRLRGTDVVGVKA